MTFTYFMEGCYTARSMKKNFYKEGSGITSWVVHL